MSTMLRVMLIGISAMTCVWILRRISKAQVRIEDAVFWLLFSAALVLMGVFPQIVTIGADILGVQSDVNFVFLGILFILIVKMFRMSIKISQLESKLQTFAQGYALDHTEK